MIAPRPAVERRVLESLEAGRIPVLLGGCGSGRTSLLLRVESRLGPTAAQYLDVAAAATTPERCLSAITSVSRFGTAVSEPPASPRDAFDLLLSFLSGATTSAGAPATFLLDDFLDVRTLENFPGLRHVQRDFVQRLASSPARFVLASRFTARVHRLLRDAPPRFEVMHVPPLDADEVTELLRLFNGSARTAGGTAALVADLTAGRPACAHLVLGAMAGMGPAPDPVAALASLFAPDGRLTARCRESYELRLGRARGFGALKAILGVLAETEPQNLTEISHALHRTPGSTKDYLSWLEDVDLVAVRSKRYVFEDPLLRLYVRLYGRPVPPGDDDVVREVGAYARRSMPAAAAVATGTGSSSPPAVPDRSGIIEID
ncbi:MAG TPA: hypothetical protein VMM93_12690 [Vicinamibacterales bacterium]|nr:hypothetical protein [Vicinamibacterales bacterium]